MRAAQPCAMVLALAMLAPLAARADEVRLGYVDIQRAIREVEDGQRAMQQLEAELSQRQTRLDEQETALRQLTEQLDQELVMMDSETRTQRLAEYQQQVQQYQELFLQNQQELMVMEQEATREIVERMVAIVAEIGAERELTMIFEKTRSALVWAADGLDLTDELIRRYEAAH